MSVEITVERVRTIGSIVRKEQMTTEQAKAFLLLHGEQLEQFLLTKFREFVSSKL